MAVSSTASLSSLARARAFLFDFDDTLVASSAVDGAALRAVLSRFREILGGARAEDLVAHYDRFLADVRRTFHATGSWAYPESRFARLLVERGADASSAPELGRAYSEERAGRLHPFPGAREAVDVLRAQGLRVGVVTNGPIGQREWMRRLGFLDAFDPVIVAGEIGVRKPDVRFFRAALDALGVGVEAAEVVVVGDSMEMDVRPAKALGCAAVYVAGLSGDERSRLFDDLPPPTDPWLEADAVVGRVAEIPRLIERRDGGFRGLH